LIESDASPFFEEGIRIARDEPQEGFASRESKEAKMKSLREIQPLTRGRIKL